MEDYRSPRNSEYLNDHNDYNDSDGQYNDHNNHNSPAITDAVLKSDDAHKSSDWLGKHNVFTRAMIIVTIAVFIYAFWIPLGVEYVNVISWVFITIFMSMLFGINSLRLIIELVDKIKGRR